MCRTGTVLGWLPACKYPAPAQGEQASRWVPYRAARWYSAGTTARAHSCLRGTTYRVRGLQAHRAGEGNRRGRTAGQLGERLSLLARRTTRVPCILSKLLLRLQPVMQPHTWTTHTSASQLTSLLTVAGVKAPDRACWTAWIVTRRASEHMGMYRSGAFRSRLGGCSATTRECVRAKARPCGEELRVEWPRGLSAAAERASAPGSAPRCRPCPPCAPSR